MKNEKNWTIECHLTFWLTARYERLTGITWVLADKNRNWVIQTQIILHWENTEPLYSHIVKTLHAYTCKLSIYHL